MKIPVFLLGLALLAPSAMAHATTPPPILALPTVAAIADFYSQGPLGTPVLVHNLKEFEHQFGTITENRDAGTEISLFFENDGGEVWVIRLDRNTPAHSQVPALMHRLDLIPDLSLIAAPPLADLRADQAAAADQELLKYAGSRHAFAVLDAPIFVGTPADPAAWVIHWVNRHGGLRQASGALYFPRLVITESEIVPASAAVAGRIAATDRAHGVWTSPAGSVNGILRGFHGLDRYLNEESRKKLSDQGINPLAAFPTYGPLIFGARTLRGANELPSDFRFIGPTRVHQLIARSVLRSDGWMADQVAGPALWSEVSAWISEFLSRLQSEGAIHSYNVACNAANNSAEDILRGRVHAQISYAPVEPSEFEILDLTFNARPADRR